MSRLTIVAGITVCLAVAAGCGSNSSTSSSTSVQPTFRIGSSVTTLSGALIGGAVQNGPFANKLTNYSTVTAPVFRLVSSAAFSSPIAVATDGTNHFIANLSNSILKIDPAGVVTTLAGTGSAGFNNISSHVSARTALFNNPTAISTDSSGVVLYIADSANNAIRKIDMSISPLTVSVLAGTGTAGSADTSLGVVASFNNPTGITVVDPYVYVVDFNSHTIRLINSTTGTVTTFAGYPGATGSTDGDRTAARFKQPARITSDGKNLYITDSGNKTVRKVSLESGLVTTIAGKAGVSGSTDGPYGTSLFNQPNGISTDGINVYVTDYPASTDSNNLFVGTVRRIELASGNFNTTTIYNGLRSPIGLTTNGLGLYVADRVTNTIVRIK